MGEAFLLVWKFPEADVDYEEDSDQLYLWKSNRVNAIADMSVVSYVKTIATIRKSYKMAQYNTNKEI